MKSHHSLEIRQWSGYYYYYYYYYYCCCFCYCCYCLRNRKHVPCFYRVIKTRAEVWENEKCCGNTSRSRVFPQFFRVLPNFQQTFSNSLIIHAALNQPEHLILVRCMGLETQWKTSWKHGRVWNPCLKRSQTRMQIFLICILIKQQKHVAINNFI